MQSVAQLLRREQPHPRGGQLDREWQPVQPYAYLSDCSCVVVRQCKARTRFPGTLDKQTHSVVLADELGRQPCDACVWHGQGRHHQ